MTHTQIKMNNGRNRDTRMPAELDAGGRTLSMRAMSSAAGKAGGNIPSKVIDRITGLIRAGSARNERQSLSEYFHQHCTMVIRSEQGTAASTVLASEPMAGTTQNICVF